MALNYYFGYDENGRVGRRTTGLRPPFGGNNRLMFITHRTPKYTECDEVRMAIQGGESATISFFGYTLKDRAKEYIVAYRFILDNLFQTMARTTYTAFI